MSIFGQVVVCQNVNFWTRLAGFFFFSSSFSFSSHILIKTRSSRVKSHDDMTGNMMIKLQYDNRYGYSSHSMTRLEIGYSRHSISSPEVVESSCSMTTEIKVLSCCITRPQVGMSNHSMTRPEIG